MSSLLSGMQSFGNSEKLFNEILGTYHEICYTARKLRCNTDFSRGRKLHYVTERHKAYISASSDKSKGVFY